MRVGGFGGVDGLVAYLDAEGVDAVVDATHPFAAVMPFHVAAAATATGVRHVRLLRPPWTRRDGDRWIDVASMADAAAALDGAGAERVFLATGRQQLDAFRAVRRPVVPRALDRAGAPTRCRRRWRSGTGARSPLEGERRLLVDHRIDTVVAKNAGGRATVAKLDAARELGLTVVMVRRPPQPDGVRSWWRRSTTPWPGSLGQERRGV